jgi:predicted GH43/DUF377 family glycosyl hydrolase
MERRKPLLAELYDRYTGQFADLEEVWLRHFEIARARVTALSGVTDRTIELLVGALLTQAYAYEGAALTNPSIVPVGDLGIDTQPFVMSARAIGEGHISSIAFLTGTVDRDGVVLLDDRHPHVSNGTRHTPDYSRSAFADKLAELGFLTAPAKRVLELLPETFTAGEMEGALGRALDSDMDPLSVQDTIKRMHWVADSNYRLSFVPSLPLSEHVISPAAPAESRGIEDARFVRFTEDDGTVRFYGTYTAFDGTRILPQLIETSDFSTFRMSTMTGPALQHKGMALFPRKVNGEYLALSRHDHERSFILRADHIRRWGNAEVVFGPETEWDIIQTGNCGSPIETESGWLVITHGVGAMRRYVLGAILLDLDEPSKVLARLRSPLIEPEGDEVRGYVPNVVYSCGSLVHGGNLITPFGYSDTSIKIAVTPLDDLLDEMD